MKTKKVTEINRSNASTLVSTSLDALRKEMLKYGITVEQSSVARFGDDAVTFKVSLNVGSRDTRLADAWAKNWKLHNLPKNGVGMNLTLHGLHYEILGLDMKKRTNIIIMRNNKNGKTYSISEITFRHMR